MGFFNWQVEFIPGPNGVPAYLNEVHVSGNYRYRSGSEVDAFPPGAPGRPAARRGSSGAALPAAERGGRTRHSKVAVSGRGATASSSCLPIAATAREPRPRPGAVVRRGSRAAERGIDTTAADVSHCVVVKAFLPPPWLGDEACHSSSHHARTAPTARRGSAARRSTGDVEGTYED